MTTTIVLGVLLALAIAVLGAIGLKLAIAAGLFCLALFFLQGSLL